MLAFLGYLIASFIMTTMLSQLFPDGRFPLTTILLVLIVTIGGAWAGDRLLTGSSIFTGTLVGATICSGALFIIFHRTGFLAQTPWPKEPPPDDP